MSKIERKDRQKLEQYYTPPHFARKCVESMLKRLKKKGMSDSDLKKQKFLEPCAGTGAFVDALIDAGIPRDNILAFDLEPKGEGIKKANVFDLTEEEVKGVIVVTNLPFGKACSLAMKITKHLFKMGAYDVYQLAPKAMTIKHYALKSMYGFKGENLLDMPEDQHFVIDDVNYDGGVNSVRCSFQAWTRGVGKVVDDLQSAEWEDVTPSCNKIKDEKGKLREQPVKELSCDFVIRSHGMKTGTVMDYEDGKHKANVTRFIKVREGMNVDEVRRKFEELDYSRFLSVSTLRHNPSIAPSEMVECYEQV